jgi:NAD(P)H dehydrogenase (quinone)
MTYLITGVTGRLGRAVLDHLLTEVSPEEIVVTVRDMSKATPFLALGVTVRQADFTQPNSLVTAFADIDKLLLISSQPSPEYSRLQQHQNAIEAAQKAGVPYIAYTSIANASASTSILAPDHAQTEQILADSGIAYTTIRNNWYLENELGVLTQARENSTLVHGAANGRVGWALIDEYAAGIVAVLLHDQPKRIYEFSGSLLSYAELAQAFTKATGDQITVQPLAPEDYQAYLIAQGMDEASASFTSALHQDIAQGALDFPADDLAQVLHKPLLPLTQAIKRVMD